MNHIKFLRNVVRCLVLPCVLSSTNSYKVVSDIFNMKSDSTINGRRFILVNAIHRLLATNLKGITERIKVKSKSKLADYVCDDYSLKICEDSAICLLQDLNVKCDDENKEKLVKIWNFMISQSKTCLQGSSYYAFYFFIQALKSYKTKSLNSCAFWNNICKNLHLKFKDRKQKAFENDGKFFSLRMFSTNKKFAEDQVKPKKGNKKTSTEKEKEEEENEGSALVRNSIDHHFFHFGNQNEPSVIKFGHDKVGLTLNRESYPLRSHFLPFGKDTFTSFALWNNIPNADGDYKCTVASIVQGYINSLVGIFASPAASSNDFRAQEVMSYWAIANASHQNFNGKTKGVDFFFNFFKNIQVHDTLDFAEFDNMNIPTSLESFLNSLSIPYLIPERPSAEFKSSLAGLCDFGVVYQCPNSASMDIGFELRRDGRTCDAFVECKYRDTSQGKMDITKYINNAKAKNSVLTFFVVYKLHDDLKSNNGATTNERLVTAAIKPSTRMLRDKTLNPPSQTMNKYLGNGEPEEPVGKKSKKNFNLNVYSFYFIDDEDYPFNGVYESNEEKKKKLAMRTLHEVNNPDGVFIVLETSFKK